MHQAVALYSRAVLAMQDDASLLQGDVQKTFATSAVSIRRYRALMARLPTVDTGTVSASSAFASRAPNTSATLSSAAVASFVAARSSSTASSSAFAAMASTDEAAGASTVGAANAVTVANVTTAAAVSRHCYRLFRPYKAQFRAHNNPRT